MENMMKIEIDDVEIEAKAKDVLVAKANEFIKEHVGSYKFTNSLRDRVKELANSCLDKVAHDLVQEMKPRMREDVMAAYEAMVKAKATKMMKALEKGHE
jgi:hypothetical protein